MSKSPAKKKKNRLLDVACWLLAAVAIAAAALLIMRLLEYKKGQDVYQELQTLYAAPMPTEQGPALLDVDVQAMQQENDAVIGWLQIDALGISYPVLKGPDNAYYLNRLPDGSYNAAGSLFMDANNTGFDDLHSIVYGHNMRDGSMFAPLVKYLDPEFYQQNGGEMIVYTAQGVWLYELFVAAQVPPDSTLYTIGFGPGAQYDAFVEQVTALAAYDMGVKPTGQDHILTLSTCTGDGAERVVVCGRRVQQLDLPQQD